MSGNGTPAPGTGLPVALAHAPQRSAYHRSPPGAAFLSQLIAERQHLPPQRARRRVPIAEAVDAYRRGGAVATLRLPAGYRRTVVA